jgi:hypothetical protein
MGDHDNASARTTVGLAGEDFAVNMHGGRVAHHGALKTVADPLHGITRVAVNVVHGHEKRKALAAIPLHPPPGPRVAFPTDNVYDIRPNGADFTPDASRHTGIQQTTGGTPLGATCAEGVQCRTRCLSAIMLRNEQV